MTAEALDMTRLAQLETRRFRRWRVAAVLGIAMALGSTLIIATGLATFVPLPIWSLSGGAFIGMLLTALAGMRLLALQVAVPKEKSVIPLEQVVGEIRPREVKKLKLWAEISRAFEVLREGKTPVLVLPDNATEDERAVIELGNAAFKSVDKRNEEVKAALDKLREEIDEFHKYLTRSQVGLIGAKSVAERLEEFEKRLNQIRSAL